MSGKAIARLLVALFLALGLVTLGVAGPKKHGDNKGPAADGQAAQAGDQQGKKASNVSHEAVDPAQYVGTETCKTCHEEQAKSFDKGPHWKNALAKHNGPEWQGCEACHGPGKAHTEAGEPEKIIRFAALSREESSKRCLGCHELGQEHANFLRSQHLKNNVGCVDCHSIHSPKIQAKLVKAGLPQLCFSCHQDVKPEFSKPFHHRVNEGLIKCTDCHNQHGGFVTRQLRSTAAQDQLCFNCHTDKAGPFAFEHPPVKTEGCVSCHAPHGSSNPRLLRRSNVNLLCLECHTITVDSSIPGTPSFHNQAQKYQACTMCHVAIHGSNSDHVFFKP